MRSTEEIEAERRALLRANRFIRDDFHRNADRMIETTSAHIRAQLAEAATYHTGEPLERRNQHGAMLLDAAAAWALTQPAFVELLHQGIDESAAPRLDHGWSKLTRKQLDEKVSKLDAELAEAERENRRAPLLEQKAELDQQLAELET